MQIFREDWSYFSALPWNMHRVSTKVYDSSSQLGLSISTNLVLRWNTDPVVRTMMDTSDEIGKWTPRFQIFLLFLPLNVTLRLGLWEACAAVIPLPTGYMMREVARCFVSWPCCRRVAFFRFLSSFTFRLSNPLRFSASLACLGWTFV